MKIMFSCLILLFTNFTLAGPIIAKMSSEELKVALSEKMRCELTHKNDSAEKKDRTVSFIEAETTDGSYAYFAEVTDSKGKSTIYYMPSTHRIIGGYKSEGSREHYLGFKISSSVNYLSRMSGGKGTDVIVEISDGVLAEIKTYYQFCEFH